MYKFEKAITLVTIASPVHQNLALMETDEYVPASSLACIHEGYINVIHILNPERRCKYVPVSSGKSRGVGLIKQVKWLKLHGETIFVVTSTAGLQIYDADVSDVKFFHACDAVGDNSGYTNGICLIQNDILCIGTNIGTVWMFKSNEGNTDFQVVERFHAHEEPVTFLDGMDKYLVTSSDACTYIWTLFGKQFEILRKISVNGLFSKPSALKVAAYLIFLGYESGELCVFDILDKKFLKRTVAHKLKITDIDFSPLKHYALSVSEDCYAKIWIFNETSSEGLCQFSIFNDAGPLYGAGFLNYNCAQFCVTTANSVFVNVYTKTENNS